jgi:hypothetical protein
MRTSSNRALARQLGVSETAVRRAEKAGRIKREPNGTWDLAQVKALWARNTDRAQQRRQHGGMKPVPEAALGAVRETLREHGEPVATGAMTFMQARTANEVLKAPGAPGAAPAYEERAGRPGQGCGAGVPARP